MIFIFLIGSAVMSLGDKILEDEMVDCEMVDEMVDG